MERTFTTPPPESVGIVKGGYWFKCANAGATATVYWFGGPKSPDRDIVLQNIDADIPGSGEGTLLMHEILAWCDEAALSISCLCPPERVEWLARIGMVAIERRYDGVVMGRSPVPVLSR